ncbi:S-adenosyl-L-methionine-dependent methyltransferase [Pyronema domesticum]|nr:S-adenosyl-L-methionine-dependent methyltransferase [Pyronema domesticum]
MAIPRSDEKLDYDNLFDTAEDILRPSEARSFLPWDKLCASPALVDLMAQKETLPIFQAHSSATPKRALVPGCDRGYDALLFAQHGYETVGVEISGSAVREAKKWTGQQIAAGQKTLSPMGFILADFFEDEWLKVLGIGKEQFDLVYDYAFLVAMNPTMRKKWAKRMADHITPGSGLLVCLEYPLFRPPESGGPPHGITSSDYDALLRENFEKEMHYMPKRTHKVGEGSDMVSVWRRKEVAKL